MFTNLLKSYVQISNVSPQPNIFQNNYFFQVVKKRKCIKTRVNGVERKTISTSTFALVQFPFRVCVARASRRMLLSFATCTCSAQRGMIMVRLSFRISDCSRQ